MNMLLRTDTKVVHIIWMWILESLENATIIVVSHYINMLSSEDTIHLANVPPPIQIWICSQEQILQLFNQFGFKY